MLRSRSRRKRPTGHGDDWYSSKGDDDLPDWKETDESYVEDLRRQVLEQTRTRQDILQHPAFLRSCHFQPLVAVAEPLKRQILAKLARLEDSLYADEALEAPGRLHVLLWLPPGTASVGNQQGGSHPDGLCGEDLPQLFDAAELRRTRLADPYRYSSSSAVSGTARAAATAAAGTEPTPAGSHTAPKPRSERDPHLLGFCVLGRRRDPTSSGRFNTIEFFNTLCSGYNLGQLMYERAGEMCCRRHLQEATAAGGAETAESGVRGASAGAVSAASSAAVLSLAAWPLPSAPRNIFYWVKLERIPVLGRGGMLRVFAEVQRRETPLSYSSTVAAPANMATAALSDGVAGSGSGARARIRGRDTAGGKRPRQVRGGLATARVGSDWKPGRQIGGSSGGLSAPTGGDASQAGIKAGDDALAAAGAAADAAGGTGVPGLLAAFRHFCVSQLSWEPVEVEAYLGEVGAERAAAAALLAAAGNATAANAVTDNTAAQTDPTGEGDGSAALVEAPSDNFAGACNVVGQGTASAAAGAPAQPSTERQLQSLRPQHSLRSSAVATAPCSSSGGNAASSGGRYWGGLALQIPFGRSSYSCYGRGYGDCTTAVWTCSALPLAPAEGVPMVLAVCRSCGIHSNRDSHNGGRRSGIGRRNGGSFAPPLWYAPSGLSAGRMQGLRSAGRAQRPAVAGYGGVSVAGAGCRVVL